MSDSDRTGGGSGRPSRPLPSREDKLPRLMIYLGLACGLAAIVGEAVALFGFEIPFGERTGRGALAAFGAAVFFFGFALERDLARARGATPFVVLSGVALIACVVAFGIEINGWGASGDEPTTTTPATRPPTTAPPDGTTTTGAPTTTTSMPVTSPEPTSPVAAVVPDGLVGQRAATAIGSLVRSGLNPAALVRANRCSNDYEVGVVTRTAPAAGEPLPHPDRGRMFVFVANRECQLSSSEQWLLDLVGLVDEDIAGVSNAIEAAFHDATPPPEDYLIASVHIEELQAVAERTAGAEAFWHDRPNGLDSLVGGLGTDDEGWRAWWQFNFAQWLESELGEDFRPNCSFDRPSDSSAVAGAADSLLRDLESSAAGMAQAAQREGLGSTSVRARPALRCTRRLALAGWQAAAGAITAIAERLCVELPDRFAGACAQIEEEQPDFGLSAATAEEADLAALDHLGSSVCESEMNLTGFLLEYSARQVIDEGEWVALARSAEAVARFANIAFPGDGDLLDLTAAFADAAQQMTRAVHRFDQPEPSEFRTAGQRLLDELARRRGSAASSCGS